MSDGSEGAVKYIRERLKKKDADWGKIERYLAQMEGFAYSRGFWAAQSEMRTALGLSDPEEQ